MGLKRIIFGRGHSRKKRERIDKGNLAENMAAGYLEDKGYKIVDRNFKCKVGEIDIVARHGEDLVFVEVRSKHSTNTFDPAYSIDKRKQGKLIKAAAFYTAKHFRDPVPVRFDVVLVTLGDDLQVELIQDAFSDDGRRFHPLW